MKKYFSLLLILLPIVTVFGQNLRGTDIKQVSNITAGTAAANKALVLNASKDISSIRNLTVSGIITIDTIMVGSTQWDIPASDSINGAVIAAGSIPSAGLVLSKDLVAGYCTDIDVSSTGVKTATLGATAKTVDATSRAVEVYYTNGGSEPGAGKAHVSITWIQSTVSP